MRFSVLLPTRNGGHFLRNCILSILEQDFVDYELIISDNANSDATPAIIAGFANDPRVRVLTLDSVVPVTENWNNALRAATGDYVLMMGDDDYLLPGFLTRMARALDEHGSPDCVLYNAFSYVAPDSISGNTGSFFSESHFAFGPELSTEGVVDVRTRLSILHDMFRFRVRIPLNMQTTLLSRRAAQNLPGGPFQPPFPDHFALNSMLLKADKWVVLPERLLVVGISPKSFGHYVYSNRQGAGLSYLGIDPQFPGRLPGNELVNGMHMWLTLLKTRYPEELRAIAIDRAAYVRRQVFAWWMQWRNRAIPGKELLGRFGLLSAADWAGLLATLFDRSSWQKLLQICSTIGRSTAQTAWHTLQPLESVADIRGFAAWLARTGRIRS